MTGIGLARQLCVISNYSNGCTDSRWFGHVSGLGRGVKKEFAESSIDESVWRLVSEVLLFQPELRLRWLHWVLLPPCGVSQVTPHPPIRTAGTPARAAICKLLLSFFLVHFDCPIFASSLSHRPGCYFQGRPFSICAHTIVCIFFLTASIDVFCASLYTSSCMTVFSLRLDESILYCKGTHQKESKWTINNLLPIIKCSLVTKLNETWPEWLLIL